MSVKSSPKFQARPAHPQLEPGHHVCSWRWAWNLKADFPPDHVSILGIDSHQSLRGAGLDPDQTCCRQRNWEVRLSRPRCWDPTPKPPDSGLQGIWAHCPHPGFHPGDLKDPREKPCGGLVPLGFPPFSRLPDPLECPGCLQRCGFGRPRGSLEARGDL